MYTKGGDLDKRDDDGKDGEGLHGVPMEKLVYVLCGGYGASKLGCDSSRVAAAVECRTKMIHLQCLAYVSTQTFDTSTLRSKFRKRRKKRERFLIY